RLALRLGSTARFFGLALLLLGAALLFFGSPHLFGAALLRFHSEPLLLGATCFFGAALIFFSAARFRFGFRAATCIALVGGFPLRLRRELGAALGLDVGVGGEREID